MLILVSSFLLTVPELEWDREGLRRQTPGRRQVLRFGAPDARFGRRGQVLSSLTLQAVTPRRVASSKVEGQSAPAQGPRDLGWCNRGRGWGL